MKHMQKKGDGNAKRMLMWPVFLVAMFALMLGVATPNCLASGLGKDQVYEFERATCFFEVNVTDFDTGISACIDGEAWQWVKIFLDRRPLFLAHTVMDLRKPPAGLTEMCFESNEPEESFSDFLDLFPPGKCHFIGKLVEGGFLKSEDDLTHNFACVPEEIEFSSNGSIIDPETTCVSAGQDLIISWEDVETRLVTLKGEGVYTCEEDEIEVDGYQVFVETGELANGDDFEPSQQLSFDLFDEETSVTIPGSFLKEETPYKFELLVIEKSGNKTILEIEFDTCPPSPPECAVDADCDDGLFCNGAEICVDSSCERGTLPCDPAMQHCNENADLCVFYEKVTICHIPPGNPDRAETLSINAGSVYDHLAHGDYLGPCRP